MTASLGAELQTMLERGVAQRVFSGACYEVFHAGRVQAAGAAGRLSPRSRFSVTDDTLFDLASLTKPLCTALATLHLVAERRLALEVTLGELCRQVFAGRSVLVHPQLRGATVWHLLTHTSGLAAWEGLYRRRLDRLPFVETLLAAKPVQAPGTHYEYSCLGYILLGELIAAVAGEPLDALAGRYLREALGMTDTGFCPPPKKRRQTAATEYCAWRGKRVRGEVHDENAAALGGVAGNAGLFSCGRDLGRFCRALLRPEGVGLPKQLRRRYLTNQLAALGGHASCGWFTSGHPMLPTPPHYSPRSFGHTGFTGTSVIIDPATEAYAFLLTNRVYYGREIEPYRQLRGAFYDALS